MRIGLNPEKGSKKIKLDHIHRVVVVVFIPEINGFYQNSLDVFKLCLDSLIRSNYDSYSITIVNNGSCREVGEMLEQYHQRRKIETLITHSKNIGKIDALIGAARGAREKIVTLTDSDILFLNNWDKEVLKIFTGMDKVGSVSPIPTRYGLYYGTSSTLQRILLKRVSLKFVEIPENYEDHNRYLESINWQPEKSEKEKWPVVEKNAVKAIVGSGHQVLSIRRELLDEVIPKEPSLTLVGGRSEYKYVDEPIDKAGLMRLSTYNNYAYHMGNRTEPWMYEILDKNNKTERLEEEYPKIVAKYKLKNVNQRLYIFRKHSVRRAFKAALFLGFWGKKNLINIS